MSGFANRPRPDFIAEVRFLTAEEGGRGEPVCSGYKASHDFGAVENGAPVLNDAEYVFEDAEWLILGKRTRAHVRMVVPEYQFRRLYEGFTYSIHEGAKQTLPA